MRKKISTLFSLTCYCNVASLSDINVDNKVIYGLWTPKMFFFNLSAFPGLYFIYLNTFFWGGVRRFRQIFKGIHGRKWLRTPVLYDDLHEIQQTFPSITWTILTLNLLTTTIVAPPSNISKWQMGFNSAFKGLIWPGNVTWRKTKHTVCRHTQFP